MRLNYNYFLQRRGLTTEKIIQSNNFVSYSEFVELLDRLRVEPPPEEEVVHFFKREKNNSQEVKDNGIKDTEVPTKKTRSRKTPARRTNRKTRPKTSTTK